MENNKWIQIKVTTGVENRDSLIAVMSMITNGLQIEDYSDLEDRILDGVYGDLIDESVLNADKTIVSVSAYVSADKPVIDHTAYIKDRLNSLGVEYNLELISLCEEDWADSWKQYYKPIKIGKRLVVVPMWEKYDAKNGEIIVKMDPGMAFGTGTHETTRLCATLLEDYVDNNSVMLDVGTGSGILAICASKLGAKECYAYDIDPVAVRVARENVRDNDVDNIECEVSDLLKGVSPKKYDVITANIVADIIIRMLPDIGKFMHEKTVLVISGIIDERCEDVYASINKNGFKIIEEIHENGWCAISLMKN
ncbi:MAG: 50S ribosomal protein L11 methyltransferase [Clostridia bacterium]|nr:50S ribosomal protein L11 methyltransferase [Clostridia bacterium]MBR2943617.1 50S ribosomal protein L11 methyltransferase [Clostridia bacterium]